jgi:hypothetical protein
MTDLRKMMEQEYLFRYAGTCTCVGPKTAKYKRRDLSLVLYHSVRAGKFLVKRNGRKLTGLTALELLKTTLDEIIQEALKDPFA